ncbi:MAG: hypothetical protein U9R27_09465 [Campylobacterota bacterium]|nr:hypothetical protein [Campylobacterota bacterium]
MKNRIINLTIKIVSFSLFIGFSIATAEEVRIMPLGDSITYGNSEADLVDPRPTSMREAYRSHLYYKLRDVAYDGNFVGSEIAGQGVSPSFDPDNEGHPGWHSHRFADHTYNFLNNNPADIILLHIGTNDHIKNAGGVELVLDQIDYFEVQNEQPVTVILALIINREEHDPIVSDFNKDLTRVAKSRIKEGDDIIIVDMEHDAGLTTGDYADNTHPNSSGYNKMANIWFDAIISLDGKPADNKALRDYPYTIIDKSYINYIYVNSESSYVTFETEIPDSGIAF